MKQFVEIKPEQMIGNPFQLIGSDWMLVTAQKEGQVNTMTASWGGLGVLWGKNVVYVVIRPTRFTKEFVDAAETFSLTFLDPVFRKQLAYLGAVSGRDVPKIEKSGLTVTHSDQTPYFAEGRLVIICRKLFRQVIDPAGFLDPAIEDNYPGKDYHTLYVAEVTQMLQEAP